MIDISSLDKAEVLIALYEGSAVRGMGVFDPQANQPLTVDEAQAMLEKNTYFDYLRGRVMKTRIEDWLDPSLYDRDNGNGAAYKALKPLFAKLN